MKLNLGTPQKIQLQQIRRSAQNNPWTVDPRVVDRIRASMQEFGQYAPIIVSRLDEQEYMLEDGRHRLDAAIASEQDEIWAYVLDSAGAEAELLGLSSNLHRRRLSDAEFAMAMKRLEAIEEQRRDGRGPAPLVTKREIADMLGSNTTDVKRTRALEKLSPGCRAAFEAGQIKKGVAYELTKVPAREQELLLPQACLVKKKALSRDAFRAMVKEARGETSGPAVKTKAKSSNVGKIHELPGVRWNRLIDTVNEVSEDELRGLPPEEMRSLHNAACDLMVKAGRMKDRLELMGVTQTASGVNP